MITKSSVCLCTACRFSAAFTIRELNIDAEYVSKSLKTMRCKKHRKRLDSLATHEAWFSKQDLLKGENNEKQNN